MLKRETLGQQLEKTRKAHAKLTEYPIESGDLVNEAGKSYMKGLWQAVKDHEKFKLEKIWIMVKIEKERYDDRAIKISYGIMDKPLKYKRESMDHWEYNYKTGKLMLNWSIPHRVEMKNFLRSPEKYSKDIIQWIKEYVKENKINLHEEVVVLS